MSEIAIERVARAIYEKRNGRGCKPWGNQPAAHKEPYLSDARAAIAAIREPTDAMLYAGMHQPFPLEAPRLSSEDCSETWVAMIDTALSEGKP